MVHIDHVLCGRHLGIQKILRVAVLIVFDLSPTHQAPKSGHRANEQDDQHLKRRRFQPFGVTSGGKRECSSHCTCQQHDPGSIQVPQLLRTEGEASPRSQRRLSIRTQHKNKGLRIAPMIDHTGL